MMRVVPIRVAFYEVDVMVEDDVRHVENYWYWYKEYHPGGIFMLFIKYYRCNIFWYKCYVEPLVFSNISIIY